MTPQDAEAKAREIVSYWATGVILRDDIQEFAVENDDDLIKQIAAALEAAEKEATLAYGDGFEAGSADMDKKYAAEIARLSRELEERNKDHAIWLSRFTGIEAENAALREVVEDMKLHISELRAVVERAVPALRHLLAYMGGQQAKWDVEDIIRDALAALEEKP